MGAGRWVRGACYNQRNTTGSIFHPSIARPEREQRLYARLCCDTWRQTSTRYWKPTAVLTVLLVGDGIYPDKTTVGRIFT